jgi:hypothetical protein
LFGKIDCFFIVFAERIDVSKLEVEIDWWELIMVLVDMLKEL